MKVKELFENKLNIKMQKGGAIPLLGVSLIVFIVTVAVYFVANYVSEGIARESALTGWDYIYTERAGVVPEADLRTYSAQNPIVTESDVRRANIYFTKTFEPSEENRTLVIRTDHAPVKIRVNGREVYNNQFDDASFVGNCYNAVTIEASSRERVVEVFMRLPFAVRFEAELHNGASAAFSPTAGFITGALLTLFAFAAFCAGAVRSLIRRKKSRVLSVGAAVLYCGAAVVLYNLPEVMYLLNLPVWTNITTLLVHMSLMAALLCIVGRMPHHRRLYVGIGFACGISALTVMLAMTPELIYVTAGVMSAFVSLVIFYTAGVQLQIVQRRTRFASALFVMTVYLGLESVIAGILLLTRSASLYIYTVTVPSFVALTAMGYISYAAFRYERKNARLYEQSARYGDSVDSISRFIRNMLACREEEQFYRTAVDEISKLLIEYNSQNSDLRCGVAVRRDGTYTELMNRGLGECRYHVIERNSVVNRRKCLFSDTYFEYVLELDGVIHTIFHFENLTGCLDMFFVSMIEAAYCGLETAFENACGSESRPADVIFTELAENAEIANGYSVEHLEHIGDYTRRLCRALGMDEKETEETALASKLHDLGKIAIPSSIINKDGRLTEEEKVIVSSHTEFGYLILSAYDDDPLLHKAAEIARYHHERWDGTGQNGLSGESIPLAARIVTVCDVYDALVSERSYKKAWSQERSLDYLADNAGKIFDPHLAEVFCEMIKQ